MVFGQQWISLIDLGQNNNLEKNDEISKSDSQRLRVLLSI